MQVRKYGLTGSYLIHLFSNFSEKHKVPNQPNSGMTWNALDTLIIVMET